MEAGENFFRWQLDGRIDNDFFDRKAAEFRSEQCRVMRDIEAHQNANQSYIEEGIKLLQVAQRAHLLFENEAPADKQKMLDFLLSNCRWKDEPVGGRVPATPLTCWQLQLRRMRRRAREGKRRGKTRSGSPSATLQEMEKARRRETSVSY